MSASHDRARLIAVVALVGVSALVAFLFRSRLGADFWPPDRATVGPNLLASLIWLTPSFTFGFLMGRRQWRKHRAHQEWEATLLARLHHAHFDANPDPHPHFAIGSQPGVRDGGDTIGRTTSHDGGSW